MKIRGFEVVSKFADDGVNLPVRGTKNAAGYDFEALEDIVIPSVLDTVVRGEELNKSIRETWGPTRLLLIDELEKLPEVKPTLVPTGVKAYMQDGEYLQLCVRSSIALKKVTMMANGVGIIDGDYYNNPSNEGHIMFQFLNLGKEDLHIKKGERIGQGIFLPYLLTDDDNGGNEERTGGFGSSGK